MPSRSALQLFAILQAHGLTVPLLELLACHCEQQHTGHVALHTKEGRIASFEQRVTGRVEALETRESASNGVVREGVSRLPLDMHKKDATL